MPILLNIGCGTDILQGYENVDIRDLSGVTAVSDVRDLHLIYELESVDEIRAIDIYEHISFTESQELLTRWTSLLKPGGRLIIRGPSIEALARRILTSTNIKDIEDSIKYIFGNQDYPGNFHYTVLHPELIIHYLRSAGINGELKIRTDTTNITIIAIK